MSELYIGQTSWLCPVCGKPMVPVSGTTLLVCPDQHDLADTTTTPRCPTCGAAMERAADGYWNCFNGHSQVLASPDGRQMWRRELRNSTATHYGDSLLVPIAPRVPCPACEGRGKYIDDSPLLGGLPSYCRVCRGRGRLPEELARLWLADGEEVNSE